MAAHADADDEPVPAQSAEERKAASALAQLDQAGEEAEGAGRAGDAAAASEAVRSLQGAPGAPAPAAAKSLRLDPALVALVADQLEMPRPRASDWLRAHDGDVVAALRAFVQPERPTVAS